MPSVSGWALRHRLVQTSSHLRVFVSMPSVSGWALRLMSAATFDSNRRMFLCPRYRAGLCDVTIAHTYNNPILASFLCPRYRAGLCDCTSTWTSSLSGSAGSFYALGIGLGFATYSPSERFEQDAQIVFLCPRYRAGLCDLRSRLCGSTSSFYALGIGLGFVTRILPGRQRPALAGSFYALGIGLGFATPRGRLACLASLRFLCPRSRAGPCDPQGLLPDPAADGVSMPSVSGWALWRSSWATSSRSP